MGAFLGRNPRQSSSGFPLTPVLLLLKFTIHQLKQDMKRAYFSTWTWGRVLAAFEWTLGVAGFLPICGQANTADFNSIGDPSHGQADLLFQNKSTGLLKVWFMNGASYTREKTITLNGSPWPVTDWQYVGVGRFQPKPAVPAIVWQHPVTRQMAVWWMKSDGTGDLTAIDTTSLVYGGYAPVGWRAVGVGNFDGTGDSDIALQHDTTGQVAIWLMNGVNQILNTAIHGNSPNWRVTGTGDFGAGGSPTTGVKDGKDDLLLTYSDPANDKTPPVSNLAGIWFMNGTTLVAPKIIQRIVDGVYYNLPIGSPDWRLLATGDFDGDGRTDAFIRDAVIGRHGIWYSSGHVFQSGTFTKPEPDPAWKLYSQDWLQSVWRHKDLYPSISVTPQSNPVRFTLSYRIKPAASGVGVTIRRREENPATGALTGWTILVSNHPASIYQDSSSTLVSGVRYEYEVMRTGIFPGGATEDIHPARIYASVDPSIDPLASRGKVLVIVDGSLYAGNGISAGLGTYTNDLIGDGWQVVLKVDAPRHDDAYITPAGCSEFECTLNAIPLPHRSDPNAAQVNKTNRENLKTDFIDQHPDAKGIVIVGHVTIPFSGFHGSDGHCDHYGAWVADAWYGHSGAGWTDNNNLRACAAFPFNSNLGPQGGGVQDGKFDQILFPSPATEMKRFVGRIDFARLPSFGTGDGPSQAEKNLINAYFAKNRAYRIKATAFGERVMALSTFDFLNYVGSQSGPKEWVHNYVYDHAFRTASALFGPWFDKVVVGDPFHQKTDSYLFGFLAGSGNPDLINENSPDHPANHPLEGNYLTHTTAQLAGGWDAKIGFYLLLGSYFGDWNMTDDFMRAAIATPAHGLAAVWIGIDSKTRWQFHGLAQGEPLGHAFLRTIKDAIPEAGGASTWTSIIGDPTLRSHVVAPPSNLSYASGTLSWQSGEPGCQFYVYHSPNMQTPFTYHAGPVSGTSASAPSTGVRMVRAVKPVTTGSGTFFNLSQGAFL